VLRLSLLPLAFSLLLSLSGCVGRETPVEAGNRTQVLHRGVGPDLTDLDPQLATTAGAYNVLSALFEGLVAEDPVDLHPVPGVAETWTQTPDGLTYTFHLRSDARWSNGDPVTAQDFIASFQRALSPSLAAPNASALYIIRGAEAYNKGVQSDFSTVGLATPDSQTLRLTLEHPTESFLSQLNQSVWFPVHLASIQRSGSTTARGNPWARPGTLVGNGPFMLTGWSPGQEIVAAKSATYWDAAQVRLQGIHFHTIGSVDTEERAFRAGQLHLTEAFPAAKIASYQRDSPDLLRIDPLLGTYFYRFNVTRPYLNKPRVRRALSLAIDRTAIVERVLGGGQEPAIGFTPPILAGYSIDLSGGRTYEEAVAEAQRLLAEAGHPGGQGLPVIELLYNTSENHRLIAEAIQEMWRQNLGVEVRLANQENSSTLDSRRTGNYEILRSSWTADFADTSNFLEIFRSDSGNNFTGWSSPDYDTLLFQAARTTDPAARRELYRRAEELLFAANPIIPLYHYTHVFAIRPEVKGWYPTALDHHPYKHVWLEP